MVVSDNVSFHIAGVGGANISMRDDEMDMAADVATLQIVLRLTKIIEMSPLAKNRY